MERENSGDESAVTSMSSVCCDFVSASDPLNDITQKSSLPDYSILEPLFSNYQEYSNDIPLQYWVVLFWPYITGLI